MKEDKKGRIDYEQFYFTEGVKLANMTFSDIKKGIKYLLKCLEMELDRGVITDNVLEQIGVAYANIFDFELSNVFFYIALNYVYKPTYLVHIAQNYIMSGEHEKGAKLLKKVIKDNNVSTYTLDFAQKIFDKLKTFSKEFYKVFGGDKYSEQVEEQMSIARDYMSFGDFDKAIDIYKTLNPFKNGYVRAELTLAYFFDGKYDKAKDVLDMYGQNTPRDLSNKLLISYATKDKKAYEDTKRKLVNLKIDDEKENFNIGLSFAQTGEPKVAVSFMEKYILNGVDESQVVFYYILACINAKLYDKAKSQLLELRDFDFFNRYIYDYYLTLCDEKRDENVEYIFNIPVKEFAKLTKKVEKLLELDEKKLEKTFQQNLFFYFYLSRFQNISKVNLLFYKLAKIDNVYASFLFNFIFVTDFVPYEFKKNYVLLRATVGKKKFSGVMLDDYYQEDVKDEYSKIFDNNFDDLEEDDPKVIKFFKPTSENIKQDSDIVQLNSKKETSIKSNDNKKKSKKEEIVTTKNALLQNNFEKIERIKNKNLNCICFMYEDKYFRFYLPNMEELHSKNNLLYEATLFAFSYIVDNIHKEGEYDIANVVFMLDTKLQQTNITQFLKEDELSGKTNLVEKGEENTTLEKKSTKDKIDAREDVTNDNSLNKSLNKIDKFKLATFIAWKILRDSKKSLSKIIKGFNVRPQDFFDFINEFDLDLE